jgi:hypothetical protein
MAYRHRWLLVYCVAWVVLLALAAVKKADDFYATALFAVLSASLWFVVDEVSYRIWRKGS